MSLVDAYVAGWALVEDAPLPDDRHIGHLGRLIEADASLLRAIEEGETDARRAALERARAGLYRRHSRQIVAAAAAALLAKLDIRHVAQGLALFGATSSGKPARRSWLSAVLSTAAFVSPQLLARWEQANAAAFAAAYLRGRAEASASAASGPPLPIAVARAAKEVGAEPVPAPSTDWVSDQLGRLVWQLSGDDVAAHEDPEAVIRRSIADGDPITASAEDLMHQAYSRAFVDWFATGPGTDLGRLAWVTESDNRVCAACDALAAEGPYDASDAPGMPAHPNCRCHYERD